MTKKYLIFWNTKRMIRHSVLFEPCKATVGTPIITQNGQKELNGHNPVENLKKIDFEHLF